VNSNNVILLIGNCGSGKTWVMKQIIHEYKLNQKAKVGKFVFQTNGTLSVLGNYDGSMFEGSDKLSMSIMTDCGLMETVAKKHGMKIICEGDRFTNTTFIKRFNPTIIKISDDGSQGRLKRKSSQSEQHLKRIQTRVQNTKANICVENSNHALQVIKGMLK
jgi:ABC-type dipeptide/oligopeptide/nickel transport system ATPase component